MPISFSDISVGTSYSRHELAEKWGYKSFQAISRGVVTPRGDDKIILFVTDEKQDTAEQYADLLEMNILAWEGPNDHFAESRMISSAKTGDEIHLFYRKRHHSDFDYLGRLRMLSCNAFDDKPSEFKFEIS